MSLLHDERGSWGRAGERTLSNIAVPAVSRPEQSEPARPHDQATPRLYRALRDYATAHPRICYALLLAGLLALALWSRYRYIYDQYTYTFGSGDAELILLKALLAREAIFSPSPELIPTPAVFDQPPLVPLFFAGLSRGASLPLDIAPFIVVPVLTSLALLAFFDLVRRTFNLPTALIASALVALLPRFSFDSTEPDKAPFVVSFVVFSLWLLVLSRERRWLALPSGLFLGLACFSHTTGYFFIPVFIVTYLVVHGLNWRSVFDWRFTLALALPGAFIGGFFYLSNTFEPQPLSAAESAQSSFLPGFVQTYVDAFRALADSGFRESAWNLYYDSIREQLTTPVYAAALAGLALALGQILRTRQTLMVPVVLWMAFVSLCFAVQFPASSHGSRYPTYVTPAFIVLAAHALVVLISVTLARVRFAAFGRTVIAMGLLLAVAYPVYTYATAPNPGLRNLYGAYRESAEFVVEQKLLEDGSHALYLGWPSVTWHLLESDPDYQDQLHTFGFGLRDLDQFTPEFIEANNVRYFILGRAASDGFDSAAVVMSGLQHHYRLTLLGRFERRPGNYAELYQLHPPSAERQLEFQTVLVESAYLIEGANIARNPHLRWTSDGALNDWTPNGRVELEPVSAASGVIVHNEYAFGGIRQVLDASSLRGRVITAVAVVQGHGATPATSAVLSLSSDGLRPFIQTFTPLTFDEHVLVVEAEIPQDIDDLRIAIATGADDHGELVIERVYILPATLDTLLAGAANASAPTASEP